MAVSVREAGGPDITAQVVRADAPRADVSDPDTIRLPSGGSSGSSGFHSLLAQYEEMGFDEVDLVPSSTGAHSLGRFSSLKFTPDHLRVSSSYSVNLINLRATYGNLDGFSTLPSDRALLTSNFSTRKLQSYAKCAAGAPADCYFNPSPGLEVLNGDFRIFLLKMIRLTGETVGKADILSSGLARPAY